MASILFAIMIVTCICISFNIWDEQIAKIFTDDGQTIWYVQKTLPMLSFFIWFDAIHGVQSGNVRAVGE